VSPPWPAAPPAPSSSPTRRSSDLAGGAAAAAANVEDIDPLLELRREPLVEGQNVVEQSCHDRLSALLGHHFVEAVVGLVGDAARSEEHTSELQSRENLVCHLLLEK